jgi:ligand-binding sensor domain-containing protein
VGDSLVYRVGLGTRQALGARDGLPSSRARAVVSDPGGRVWLGGIATGPAHRDGGVGCWDGSTWQVWRRADGLRQDGVTALFADRQGRIWAGHPDGALSLYDAASWDSWPAVPGGEGSGAGPGCGPCVGGRNGFLHDDLGRVWFVGRDGLSSYDGRQWRTWTWRNGLFGGEPFAVAQGPDGRVYVGDARSLSVLRD